MLREPRVQARRARRALLPTLPLCALPPGAPAGRCRGRLPGLAGSCGVWAGCVGGGGGGAGVGAHATSPNWPQANATPGNSSGRLRPPSRNCGPPARGRGPLRASTLALGFICLVLSGGAAAAAMHSRPGSRGGARNLASQTAQSQCPHLNPLDLLDPARRQHLATLVSARSARSWAHGARRAALRGRSGERGRRASEPRASLCRWLRVHGALLSLDAAVFSASARGTSRELQAPAACGPRQRARALRPRARRRARREPVPPRPWPPSRPRPPWLAR